MTNWLPTFPLLNRPRLPSETRDLMAELDGWSMAELLRNERFAQVPDESLPPPSSSGARAEPTAAWQPDWLTNAQRQSMPEAMPWPDPPPTPRPSISEDPFERAAIRLSRRSPRRYSPMGPPYLNEPPQDYPSHLGPVPQAPEWEEVVPTGATPWSPLKPPPRATDWGRVLTGIECRRTEDGRHTNCITPGGVRYDKVPVPAGFPEFIGPGQPDYHSYNTARLGRRRNTTSGIVREPTPGANWNVGPATTEGTPNPAAPFYVQVLQFLANRIPGVERGLGSPSWPVTSYRVVDQFGRPAVINVTAPDHVGSPGVVIRTDERLPSGRHRVRNQGAGVSALQSPNLLRQFPNPSFLRLLTDPRDAYTNHLWQSQSQNNIIRAYRNSRRNYPYGLPLE